MSDDDRSVRHKGINGVTVDYMSFSHLIGNAVEPDRIVWNGDAGLVERTELVEHGAHAALVVIGKLDHPEFNDLIGSGVQACCLDVDQNAGSSRVRMICKMLSKAQPSEDSVLARLFEGVGHTGKIELSPPVIAAHLRDTHRLIPSLYPPTGVLDLITRPEDFEAIAELEGWTNDRISAELGVLSIVPAPEWVVGRTNATVIMAAFCHPHEAGGRFNSNNRGAWYAALSIETAIAETVYHRSKEIAESGILETRVQMRQYLADFDTEFHDVRTSTEFEACHDPDSYAAGQQLGASLLAAGSDGLWYRSVRNPGDECIVCFRPTLITNVRPAAHFEYSWEGQSEPKVTQIS